MKLIFQNRLLHEPKGDVGLGAGLQGIRLTKYGSHVGDSRFFGEHRYSMLFLGRTSRQQLFQSLSDNQFPPVASRRKQEL